MKLILYKFPNCLEAEKIKEFLERNNILYEEVSVDGEEKRNEARKAKQVPITNTSFLKIVNSHSIHIMTGYNESGLSQLLSHIEKYKPKIT